MKRFELSTLSRGDALPLSYIRSTTVMRYRGHCKIMQHQGSLGQAKEQESLKRVEKPHGQPTESA